MKILIPLLVLAAFAGCSTTQRTDTAELQWRAEDLIGHEFAFGAPDGDRILFKKDEATILSSTLFSAFPTNWSLKKGMLHLKMQVPQSNGIEIVERNLRLLESHIDYLVVSENGNNPYRFYKLTTIEQDGAGNGR